MKLCDLHTHSSYSDGSFTPSEIIKEAQVKGLSAVALTDHNTFGGLAEFFEASKSSSVEGVGGVEITTEYKGKELHIVALFVDPNVHGELNDLLEMQQLIKDKANYDLYKRLKAEGYIINYANILEAAKKGSVNRVHFANELIRCGYIENRSQAFDDLLSEERGLYVPAKRLDAFYVIRLLSSLSLVSVLAHPFLCLDCEELREFLPKAVEAGLCAMETDYSTFSEEETMLARSLASEFGLSRSGGSDFHGINKPDISLGHGRGNLAVPYDYYLELKSKLPL